MQFEAGHIYHIYNQGNNRQPIFFEREHYLFFLQKMRAYLLPFCDILSYCLMPNHFHLMVEVKSTGSGGATLSRTPTINPTSSPSDSLNKSIGILLASYTRAINKQQNRSGSLFRSKTKAECITKPEGITPSFYRTSVGTIINTHHIETHYPQVCFNYIHQNPVKAGFVNQAEGWEFSSCRDVCGMRHGTFIAKELISELRLIAE